MRVVTLKVLAEEAIERWRDQRSAAFSFSKEYRDYLKIISKALDDFNGEDVLDFVNATYRKIGRSYAVSGLAIYCGECNEECSVAIEVEDDEESVYLCESCLERALGMLRGETNKGE